MVRPIERAVARRPIGLGAKRHRRSTWNSSESMLAARAPCLGLESTGRTPEASGWGVAATASSIRSLKPCCVLLLLAGATGDAPEGSPPQAHWVELPRLRDSHTIKRTDRITCESIGASCSASPQGRGGALVARPREPFQALTTNRDS